SELVGQRPAFRCSQRECGAQPGGGIHRQGNQPLASLGGDGVGRPEHNQSTDSLPSIMQWICTALLFGPPAIARVTAQQLIASPAYNRYIADASAANRRIGWHVEADQTPRKAVGHRNNAGAPSRGIADDYSDWPARFPVSSLAQTERNGLDRFGAV